MRKYEKVPRELSGEEIAVLIVLTLLFVAVLPHFIYYIFVHP